MNNGQKINKITQGFIGDVFGSGSVDHKIINKYTKEETRLKWVDGCFGCYLNGKRLDVYDILHDDNLIIVIL